MLRIPYCALAGCRVAVDLTKRTSGSWRAAAANCGAIVRQARTTGPEVHQHRQLGAGDETGQRRVGLGHRLMAINAVPHLPHLAPSCNLASGTRLVVPQDGQTRCISNPPSSGAGPGAELAQHRFHHAPAGEPALKQVDAEGGEREPPLAHEQRAARDASASETRMKMPATRRTICQDAMMSISRLQERGPRGGCGKRRNRAAG